jgi:hypothetical protein
MCRRSPGGRMSHVSRRRTRGTCAPGVADQADRSAVRGHPADPLAEPHPGHPCCAVPRRSDRAGDRDRPRNKRTGRRQHLGPVRDALGVRDRAGGTGSVPVADRAAAPAGTDVHRVARPDGHAQRRGKEGPAGHGGDTDHAGHRAGHRAHLSADQPGQRQPAGVHAESDGRRRGDLQHWCPATISCGHTGRVATGSRCVRVRVQRRQPGDRARGPARTRTATSSTSGCPRIRSHCGA